MTKKGEKIMKNIKNWVNNLLNKKSKFDLDNDGKIESYREEINGVFSQFKRMHDKLGEVNNKLQVVISEEVRAKEIADKRIQKATDELNANNKLQDRVKDFIL